MIEAIKKHWFLFTELVKRDFKKKYKRTYLGMVWSLLSPLLTLLIMRLVFTQFFGRIDHYTTYLFCGNMIFAYFSDSASRGMISLHSNSGIFTKINVPKYIFLFSTEVSALINFGLTFIVFLVFCIIDGVMITPFFLLLIIPIICLVIFNLGVGLILSALFVFFRDLQYLWGIFTTLLMYMSAIFYDVAQFPEWAQKLFLLNPVYVYISFFRTVVLGAAMPSLTVNLLALGYALVFFIVGALIYKKCNHKFIYYV